MDFPTTCKTSKNFDLLAQAEVNSGGTKRSKILFEFSRYKFEKLIGTLNKPIILRTCPFLLEKILTSLFWEISKTQLHRISLTILKLYPFESRNHVLFSAKKSFAIDVKQGSKYKTWVFGHAPNGQNGAKR